MKTKIIFFVSCLLLIALTGSFGQKVWRPFNDDSPWNWKIPAKAETDLQSMQLIDDLAKGDFFINIDEWSIPVYFINSDSTLAVNVINSRPGIFGKGFDEPNRIPIRTDFMASLPVGDFSDNHLCIVDTLKGLEWGMWAARKNNDGVWTTGLGAVTDLKSDGVEKPWYEQANEFDAHRSRASGFPLIAGLIMPHEIKAGRINHALVFAYQRGRSEFFIPPASTAQATIMEMNNLCGIPMGGRIQLDPDIDVDTLKLSSACKVIARTLQEYGAFNGDYAGATVLYADNSPSALKEWKGVLRKEDLLKVFTSDFVRNHFRVIEMGNILPGQNLTDGRLGFVSFDFPGSVRVSINWLKRRVDCLADPSVDLAAVAPVFYAASGNASVFINGEKQESGRSTVNFTSEVVYSVQVPEKGTRQWIVKIKKD